MAEKTLAGFKRGMDRQTLRATPKNGTFFNLLNCYVTSSYTVRKRPGFRKIGSFDAATKGLFSNGGKLHAFYTGAVVTPADDFPVQYDGLQPDADGVTLTKVWADYLFLGRQYVVAEFSDGDVRHFWLPSSADGGTAPTWKANTTYNVDAMVQPTVPNGYYYVVGNTQFPQAWQPNTTYEVGDVRVPKTLNGWKYTVIEADGDNPSSGATEPDWPEFDGATVTEEHDDETTQPTPPQVPPSNPGGDRYNNPLGVSERVPGVKPQ